MPSVKQITDKFRQNINQVGTDQIINDEWLIHVLLSHPHSQGSLRFTKRKGIPYEVHSTHQHGDRIISYNDAIRASLGLPIPHKEVRHVKASRETLENNFRSWMLTIEDGDEIADERIVNIIKSHPRYDPGHTYHKLQTKDGSTIQERKGGVPIDVMSYHKAISFHLGLKVESAKARLSKAARNSVEWGILHFKRNTGLEVDHCDVSFSDILNGWLTEEEITEEDVPIHRKPNGWIELTAPYKQRFAAYHKKHAVLELVTRDEHLERERARALGYV